MISSTRRAVIVLAGMCLSHSGDILPLALGADKTEEELAAIRSTVFRKACTSVVQVNTTTALGVESGCGFFVDGAGLLATVLSTVEESEKIVVGYGGRQFNARLLAVDPATRVALLKLDNVNASPGVELGRSHLLEVGDYVFAVNHATDVIEQCLTGRLSGREKDFRGSTFATSMLRVNIVGAGDDSFGAPVLDRDGKVCGVLLLKMHEQHGTAVSYVLPVEVVHKVLRDYHKNGKVEQSWLGLGMEAGTTSPEIKMLKPESPASTAGLQIGDIVCRIGERKVREYQDVVDACFYLTAGESVNFDVLRGLREVRVMVVPIALAERPEVPTTQQGPEGTKAGETGGEE